MDDVRAVMDAAGSERAALFGMSEGAMMCMLFAAAHPERTSALILWGAMARSTWAEDYPWAPPREAVLGRRDRCFRSGAGCDARRLLAELADDPHAREMQGRFERLSAARREPRGAGDVSRHRLREALPLIRTPTRFHRRGDHAVNYGPPAGWRAHRGRTYVELDGVDHFPWVGAGVATASTRSRSSSPASGPRLAAAGLATVLFTDSSIRPTRGELGDRRWRELLEDHQALARERSRVPTGASQDHRGRLLATFDGRRGAVECAPADRRRRAGARGRYTRGSSPAIVRIGDAVDADRRHSGRGSPRSPGRGRSWRRGGAATGPTTGIASDPRVAASASREWGYPTSRQRHLARASG